MKAIKLILLSMFLPSSILDAGIMYHTLISMTEQKVMGQTFKHVMRSGNAAKDEFFIDGRSMAQEVYQELFEQAQKKEWEQDQLKKQTQQRAYLEFVDKVQVDIAAKLLNKVVVQIAQLFDRVQNPALERFFVFTDSTIESHDQLMQLKMFTEQLRASIPRKVENNDFESLNLLYTKLEFWPMRLEKFFQDTVQNAIKTSDDTMMLKELLKLVSESTLLS